MLILWSLKVLISDALGRSADWEWRTWSLGLFWTRHTDRHTQLDRWDTWVWRRFTERLPDTDNTLLTKKCEKISARYMSVIIWPVGIYIPLGLY